MGLGLRLLLARVIWTAHPVSHWPLSTTCHVRWGRSFIFYLWKPVPPAATPQPSSCTSPPCNTLSRIARRHIHQWTARRLLSATPSARQVALPNYRYAGTKLKAMQRTETRRDAESSSAAGSVRCSAVQPSPAQCSGSHDGLHGPHIEKSKNRDAMQAADSINDARGIPFWIRQRSGMLRFNASKTAMPPSLPYVRVMAPSTDFTGCC